MDRKEKIVLTISLGKDFFEMTPKAMIVKKKKNESC
jgi:hypothetical protein